MLMSSNLHCDLKLQIVSEFYSSLKNYTALPVPQCITVVILHQQFGYRIVTYSGVKVTFSSCSISSFNHR